MKVPVAEIPILFTCEFREIFQNTLWSTSVGYFWTVSQRTESIRENLLELVDKKH